MARLVVLALALSGCGSGSDSEMRPVTAGMTSDVPAAVVEACEEAERAAAPDVHIVCPPVVPEGRTEAHLARRYGRDGYVLDFFTEDIEPEPHWLVMASSPAFIRQSLTTNGTPRLLKRVRIAGMPSRVYTLDYYNQNQGHVVFVWRYRETSYLASVHGLRNEKLAHGIAKGLIEQMRG